MKYSIAQDQISFYLENRYIFMEDFFLSFKVF